MTSYKIQGNSLKLHQGRLSSNKRKNFFAKKVVKHWERLPRKVVESPSPEVFKIQGDMDQKTWFSDRTQRVRWMIGSDNPEGLF